MVNKSHNSATTPTFKLTRHVKGWVAKIGGKVKWLAPLDKPQLALERYHQKMAVHLAGVVVKPVSNEFASIGHLGDLFIASKEDKAGAGELKRRTVKDYIFGVQKAVDFFGYDRPALSIVPADWQRYRTYIGARNDPKTKEVIRTDPHTMQRNVGAVRTLSKWSLANEHIDRPFRFGTEFNLPSQKVIRASKREAGVRTLSPSDVRNILIAADKQTRAIFLLAINGGIGNTDLSNMDRSNVVRDVIRFERSKTEVPRLIPLWPETVAALKAVEGVRVDAKLPEHANRVFLTPTGRPLVRDHLGDDGELTSTTDRIGMEFSRVAKSAGVKRSFYDARRTFQTIGDQVGPEHVVKAIMGHTARGEDMSSRYRQSIPLEKLKAVVDHVRQQLSVSKSYALALAEDAKRESAKAPPSAKPSKSQRRQARTAK